MEPVVGIFVSRQSAADAARQLRSAGFASERVQMLLPSTPHAEDAIPTDDAEQAGVGQAVGGVVGGAMGASAGLGLGAAAASLLLPGVGAVTAVGLAAAALFGAGGAVGGAALGGALEEKTREGLPRDEAYLYEDALAHGRTVVFALPESDEELKEAKTILERSGAETLDAARETWWIGLRDAERAHYEEAGGDFGAGGDRLSARIRLRAAPGEPGHGARCPQAGASRAPRRAGGLRGLPPGLCARAGARLALRRVGSAGAEAGQAEAERRAEAEPRRSLAMKAETRSW